MYGFLRKYGLENEVKVNVEQGHAILAGHSFEHELATASALGIFGSIDMNRNDDQSGWYTDQFPNNVPEMALAYYQVLQGGFKLAAPISTPSYVASRSIRRIFCSRISAAWIVARVA